MNTMTLTKSERMALMTRVRSRRGRAEDARRARVILLLSEGRTWDATLGRTYVGPEVIPRLISARSFEVGADERTTMAIFEQAARSVVFIANTAIRREAWTLNLFESPPRLRLGYRVERARAYCDELSRHL